MPELAEVEFNRKQWNVGIGMQVLDIELHEHTRPLRGHAPGLLPKHLTGAKFLRSEARGKQMLLEFSGSIWLGIHLGMTGRLHVEPPGYKAQKHDHLLLRQSAQTLVFTDPRQFGRIRFHQGPTPPDWWTRIPPGINSPQFTKAKMESFLARHPRLALKAALLLQDGFPGIGNWMADETLWRAKIHPRLRARRLTSPQATALWKQLRFVCRLALRHIGPTYAEMPKHWFFHQRWTKGGQCPIHGEPLSRATIGGRTTAWCPKCQVLSSKAKMHFTSSARR